MTQNDDKINKGKENNQERSGGNETHGQFYLTRRKSSCPDRMMV